MSQDVDNRPSRIPRLLVIALLLSLVIAIILVLLLRKDGDRLSIVQLGPPVDSPVWDTKIAFRSNREVSSTPGVYTINPDGSNLAKISSLEYGSSTPGAPAWSPDGEWLAITGFKFGKYDIFAIKQDGTNEVNLTNDPDHELDPVWSPDGRSLAFTSTRGRVGGAGLFVFSLDGSLRELPTDPQMNSSKPSWSPDGKRLVVQLSRFNEPGTLFVINADGTGLRRLLQNPKGGATPSWSPDGKRIAFSAGGIWTIDADGSNSTELIHTKEILESEPVWSPDGSMIAFTRTPPQNEIEPNCSMCATPELWIMNSDGTAARRVLDNSRSDNTRASVSGVSWQPLPRRTPLPLPIPTPSPIPSPKGTDLTQCTPGKVTRTGERPSTFVGARRDGRVVVAKTADGEIERVLATFAGYPGSPEALAAGEAEVHHIALSSDGSRMFFSTGPFGLSDSFDGTGPRQNRGYIWHVCTTGGEAEKVVLGQDPELSPDGQSLAFVQERELHILNLASGLERRLLNDTGHQVSELAWSSDSRSLAFETYCEACPGVVRLLEIESSESLSKGRKLGPSSNKRSGTGWGSPAFRKDGMLTITEYCCAYDSGAQDWDNWLLTVDPASGRIRERIRIDRYFARIDYDSSGSHQLMLHGDERGQVFRRTAGRPVKVTEGYLDVEW